MGMVKSFAKFTATMGKGIKVGDSDVEIKLTLPLKVVQENFLFLSTNQGEKINVFLGDPQAALDFGDEEEDMYRVFTGRRVTTDASGVVTSVQQPDEQKDENQAELPLEKPVSEGEQEHHEEHPGDPAGDTPAEEIDDELNDYKKEIMGEGSTQEGSDLPEWMQEQQHEEKADEQEMSFEDSDQEPTADGASDLEESQPSCDEEISKEKLEQYILSQRPSFPDHPLDFPELLERKRAEDVTWRELANSVGMTSGQLNGKYAKYKEAVKKEMQGNGVA